MSLKKTGEEEVINGEPRRTSNSCKKCAGLKPVIELPNTRLYARNERGKGEGMWG